MKASDGRILTTHTGSLPRPRELTKLYGERSRGRPEPARASYGVAEAGRRQPAAGEEHAGAGRLGSVGDLGLVASPRDDHDGHAGGERLLGGTHPAVRDGDLRAGQHGRVRHEPLVPVRRRRVQ